MDIETKQKLYKIFIRLDIVMVILMLAFQQFILAFIFGIPILYIICSEVMRAFWFYFTKPFRFLHRLFTKRLPYGDANYKNNFEVIVFWYFGNIAYFTFLIFLICFFFTYKPYKDGYICRDSEYKVGDTVIVELDSKNKVIGIVEEFWITDDKERLAKISINDKIITANNSIFATTYSSPVIRGHYNTEDENIIIQVFKSGWGLTKNLITSFQEK